MSPLSIFALGCLAAFVVACDYTIGQVSAPYLGLPPMTITACLAGIELAILAGVFFGRSKHAY